MAIQFSVQEAPASRIAVSSVANLEDLGISSLVLHEEPRLTQNLEAAARIASGQSMLNIFCSHWAGDIEPVVAANQLAFLDSRVVGRLGLRIAEKSNDTLGHEANWRRIDEYLTLLKRLWSNEKPFDHECEFYSIQQGFVENKGPQRALMPIRMTGLTGTAMQVCARHATIFDVAFGARSEVGAVIAKMKESASRFGRTRNLTFALHVPNDAFEKFNWPSSESVARAKEFLLPYSELGVSEFIFGMDVIGQMGAAPIRTLKHAFLDIGIKESAPLVKGRFGRVPRLVN